MSACTNHSYLEPVIQYGCELQDQILKKCMIILREDVREETGNVLLTKLADVWTQFFTSILPTLQAIFATVELKISIRTITLLSFRDIVLLKTAIEGVLSLSYTYTDV